MSVVVVASRVHYAVHAEAIVEGLPELDGEDVALVASYADLRVARARGYRRIAYLEHGSGQSYGGDPSSRVEHDPYYAGGEDHAEVGLFLVPNEHAGWRWQRAYPDARVAVVGSAVAESLPRRRGKPGAVVAIGFHWECQSAPESASAIREYIGALPDLASSWTILGHGHPRRRDLALRYRRAGIEHVPDFREVCERADVYVADNTSTLFEFASTGRPVVVLNGSRWRRYVEHGLRFWACAGVGANVDDPRELGAAIAIALEDPPALRLERELALDRVYQPRTGGAELARQALIAFGA